MNLIDTADAHGPEVSERLIREALRPYPKDLVIATKGGLVRPARERWDHDTRPEHVGPRVVELTEASHRPTHARAST